VIRDEKDDEQEVSCQGSRFLGRSEQGGEGESWQGMPQVKELKELKLPVGNEKKGRYTGQVSRPSYLPFYCMEARVILNNCKKQSAADTRG
jgi:hypothetical protein